MSRAQGAHWERATERWLRRQGIQIIDRNFHSRLGEIDLIVRDGDAIAFVEIKFRSRQHFGSGADQVTPGKQRRIVAAARTFLQYHKCSSAMVLRFDVISISQTPDGEEIQWIKSAFDAV